MSLTFILSESDYVRQILTSDFFFSELLLSCVVSAFDSVNVNKKSSIILDMVQNSADQMGKYT